MIGSLCSGYGGLDLAVEAVFGQPVAWHCENDPAPSRVLDAHWPGTPNMGDLTTVAYWLHKVEPVDVLAAGYPCQPFSHAGKRKGTDDERHLWPYVADAIRGIRPRIVVLENVAGHRSLGFDTVQADLAALRYDTRWTSLRAADVGAPHGRERVFILATDTDDRTDHRQRTRPPEPRSRSVAADPGSETVRLRAGLRPRGPARVGRGRPDDHPASAVADSDQPGLEGHGGLHPTPRQDQTAAQCRGTVADATGDGRHERRPEPARLLRRPDAAERGASPTTDTEDGIESREPTRDGRYQPVVSPGTRTGARDSAGRTAERIHQLGRDSRPEWGPYRAAIERWERVLGRPAPPPTEPGTRGGQRLSPRFVEWLMGLPAGWATDVDGISRNEMLRMLGNGVVPQQAEAALRTLTEAVAA